MSGVDLLALAETCEAADVVHQSRLIEEAWELLAEHCAEHRRFAAAPCRSFDSNAGRFAMMLDATAYESAAIMLVPEGWAWMAGCAAGEGYFANLAPTDESGIEADSVVAVAATPALALVSAALRARHQSAAGEGEP